MSNGVAQDVWPQNNFARSKAASIAWNRDISITEIERNQHMVREARFSWDDADGREPPLRYDRIDEFDDELLDPDPPLNIEPTPKKPETPRQRRKRRRSESESSSRHLAGADWIGDKPAERDDEAA